MPFGNGYRWVEVAPADAATTIAIVPPPPGKPTGNVETGIALHTDDIDAVHADLKARGVDVDEEVSRMGDPVPPMFWFRDPDGNTPAGRREPLSSNSPPVPGSASRRARPRGGSSRAAHRSSASSDAGRLQQTSTRPSGGGSSGSRS